MSPATLPKDRQRELRLEEVFRDQVRKQLETADPILPKERLWKALNEPFMLWILSTILGGFLVWGYN